MRTLACSLTLLLAAPMVGCGSDSDSDEDGSGGDGAGGPDAGAPGDDEGPLSLVVSGTVLDFATGQPIAVQPTLATEGLVPAPSVSQDGAAFTLAEVASNSTFHLIVSAPEFRTSVGATVTVAEADLDGVEARIVSEPYLATLAGAFEADADVAGLVLARAVDENGAPRAGVPAAAFAIAQPDPALGPYFLDAELRPAPELEATSESGWVVFFQVAPGLTAITAPEDSGYFLDMPTVPVQEGAATIAEVVVTDGEAALPTGVSFTRDLIPMFEERGCADCHSGNGPGKDLANLTLDGGANKIYSELMEPATNPGLRVDLATPEASLILTMPSAEEPPDGHPTVVFASPNDPDYLKLLVWISEGAANN